MNKEHTGIVANLAFLGLTTNLVDAVLYTPLEDGNFLISVVAGGGTAATPNSGQSGRPFYSGQLIRDMFIQIQILSLLLLHKALPVPLYLFGQRRLQI